ncbi:MAG: RtcB family protein [Gammaproteobacteria bacterium]
MNLQQLEKITAYQWLHPAHGDMRVPVVLFGDETLLQEMDDKVLEQACNVATLPGIVGPSYAMPDAHWGYGFPIGGVAAFDAEQGGVISAGGVGFDISCGVRSLRTGLQREHLEPFISALADALFRAIPAGLGSRGRIRLSRGDMDAMLRGGAVWAVAQGYGEKADLEWIEERGCMAGADPEQVSEHAHERQKQEMGTLGSGNHYLEVQQVSDVYDAEAARVFGVATGDILITIHCGSRGLGHQIGTEFLKHMQKSAAGYGIRLPDRELACTPLLSPVGQAYLGAMRAAINCALANRQIITHLTREVFADLFPETHLDLLFDVSHNTCKLERHTVEGETRNLYVHRKGATRAFGPGHPDIPERYRRTGQPVLIGGTMGTASYILAGNAANENLAYASACHGAGRGMSRRQALKTWRGRNIVDALAEQGILIRSPSLRGVAEEAPGAYKDVDSVVMAADRCGLARRVARLKPVICIKG